MKPHGHLLGLGDGHGLAGLGRPHHQARAGEDAVTVGAPHRLVHFGVEAEVVGRHDQALHTSIRALPRKAKTRPRQCTFRPVRLANHTNRPAVSRNGSSHSRRIPSPSPRSIDVAAAVASRTASVTVSTSQDAGPARSAYRPAKGMPRTSQVKKKATGLATRVFWSQYTWCRHQTEGCGRSTPVTATCGTRTMRRPAATTARPSSRSSTRL